METSTNDINVPVDDIIAYEQGELDQGQLLELFSKLIRSGVVWEFQGHYGRTAAALIDAGWIDDEGNIADDWEERL